ncbi:MAG: AMP-binding protein [Pseudomonadota bacterium]
MSNQYYLSMHAESSPESAACILAETGEKTSYRELEESTNQIAHLFRSLGLEVGDGIVVMCQNHSMYYKLLWASHRAGLYFTPISWHSTAEEAQYIIENSEAKAFIASSRFGSVAETVRSQLGNGLSYLSVFGEIEGYTVLERAMDGQVKTLIRDETAGREMLYTSGTTGRPKGVKFPLSGKPVSDTAPDDLSYIAEGYGPGAVVLAPGPLYHASPLMSSRAMHRFGGTALVIDKFDAERTLRFIEAYKVTHLICVPTHFIRMLKLPDAVRKKYDVSSVKLIMHTGAPCPVETKYAMIDWFGPIITEFYGGTERVGGALIRSDEWLKHPGSIGKSVMGTAYVVDEATWEVLPAGETGVIYFDTGEAFAYHGDEKKTKDMYSPQGWRTLGDIGRMDEDGYIYLSDRKSNMIISGGVNVYPQEAESRLITHPKVDDVAVFGIPNEAFGEEVKAVVQPAPGVDGSVELEAELIAYCKETLAGLKCPRTIDFDKSLPRQDNGKLYKKALKERYL